MPSFIKLMQQPGNEYLEEHVRLALSCAVSALDQHKAAPEDVRAKLSVDLCLTELVRLLRGMNIQDSLTRGRCAQVSRYSKERKPPRLSKKAAKAEKELELEFEDGEEV